MIRNLIWDFDGTLFDTYPSILQSFLRALESLGVSESPADVLSLARVGLTHGARILAARHSLDQDDLADRFSRVNAAIPKVSQPPFDGVKQVCRWIVDAGGINAIVTHRGRASTQEMLVTHAMHEWFTDIAAGDEGYPRKPDPAAFLAMIERHGIRPAETAAVGDRDIDVLAGRAAGLQTCLFLPPGAPATGTEVDFTFSDYTELLTYIEIHSAASASE